MTRSVPPDLQRLLEQSGSGVAIVAFVTITHPEMDEVVRLVRDGVDYLIDDVAWSKSSFNLSPVTDTDEAPRSRFRFPNVDYGAVMKLRRVNGPARVSFHYAGTTAFDRRTNPRRLKTGAVLETFWPHQQMFLTNVTINEAAVEGDLQGWDYSQEMWPDLIATQDLFPGLYVQ